MIPQKILSNFLAEPTLIRVYSLHLCTLSTPEHRVSGFALRSVLHLQKLRKVPPELSRGIVTTGWSGLAAHSKDRAMLVPCDHSVCPGKSSSYLTVFTNRFYPCLHTCPKQDVYILII